jgi:hypothetical protein
VPLPERTTPTEASDAFELSESIALADPAAVGAKITDMLVLVPAASVYGKEMPLTLKPAPLMLAAEIVTLDPPEFDKVNACVWLLPTITLPRFMLEALTPK